MKYSENSIKNILPIRPKDSHKGTFGHVLNIAGSGFYSGAAYFSSLAPLRVGAGRSTLASVDFVLRAVCALSPDIILLPLDSSNNNTVSKSAFKFLEDKLEHFDVVSIGCGIAVDDDTIAFFIDLINYLKNSKAPLVIDADGLNILSNNTELKLPQNTILTPHPLELSRILNVPVEEVLNNPEFFAKKCSEKFSCITVLKSHRTIVADFQNNLYINNTGNSALAKGGSGDVLTGMISGFLAQGVNPFDASVLSVYLHGKAGELAGKDLSLYSVLASDLLDYIPSVIKKII